jgi:solute carrier family 7 (L-type amino acid transporter), member 9/15
MLVSCIMIQVLLGWVVLSGRTRIEDPHVNFRHAFAGSSHSSNDVRLQKLCATKPSH